MDGSGTLDAGRCSDAGIGDSTGGCAAPGECQHTNASAIRIGRIGGLTASLLLVRRGCTSGLPADRRCAQDANVSDKQHTRLVYSTATDGKCPTCGWPQRNCQCSTRKSANAAVPARIVAKLRMEKKGRGGKTVTVVYGLPENEGFLKDLSQKLKRACGTGGAVVDGEIELQGELRDRVRELLQQQGYTVKG